MHVSLKPNFEPGRACVASARGLNLKEGARHMESQSSASRESNTLLYTFFFDKVESERRKAERLLNKCKGNGAQWEGN